MASNVLLSPFLPVRCARVRIRHDRKDARNFVGFRGLFWK